MSIQEAKAELRKKANANKGKLLAKFFKTGKGEYAEGDVFIGVMVPQTREVAKKFKDLTFIDLKKLLKSKIHEERLLALCILVTQYQKASPQRQKEIFEFYIRNRKGINNWDLVDVTVGKIVGTYLFNKPKALLYKFARSKNLWEKRIAIISTQYFISQNQYADTLKIAAILLKDEHDLIHKAVGWMLREVGKRDLKTEERFLKKHYKKMPRTMLRYAIEKFPESKRKKYLYGF